MRLIKFGMGAKRIASGRRPSMDTITTRRAGGVNVGVVVGDGVSVSVAVCEGAVVAVAVAVNVGVWVAVDVKVGVGVEVGATKGSPAATGI
jgi:hypothetical protein